MFRTRVVYDRPVVVVRKRYGFWAFIFDALMTLLTSGLWLIWVFVREMRKQRYY